MEKITINTEYIKLQQLLKLANITSQGSDAKILVIDGMVKVNGSVVFERGKKIRAGDVVEVAGFRPFEVSGD